MELGLTAISQVINDESLTQEAAQSEVKRILHSLTFGEDGYFFVYDGEGVNLVHPAQPELVGQPLITLRDGAGDLVIASLLNVAKQGGGYHRYTWRKPSLGDEEDKLGYVVELPKWGWILGTGLYVDDIAKEISRVRQQVTINIRNSFLRLLC